MKAARLPEHAAVMAFDFGLKRIGVATGNTGIGIATALTTIEAQSNAARLQAVGLLVREWQPLQLVVGLPHHADGAPHEVARLAKKFGNRLTEQFRLPVDYVDETLTSHEAAQNLRSRGTSAPEKTKIDAEAAAVILQSWLDTYRSAPAHAA
jgi:putative Holliday junction resolvase